MYPTTIYSKSQQYSMIYSLYSLRISILKSVSALYTLLLLYNSSFVHIVYTNYSTLQNNKRIQ